MACRCGLQPWRAEDRHPSYRCAYDRGEKKFATYRRIASMRDYVLIDPDLKRIELFRHAEHGIRELHASLEIEVSWDRVFGNVD